MAPIDLRWEHDVLYFGRKRLLHLVMDSSDELLWRVSLPKGTLSDRFNITRAREHAEHIALRLLDARYKSPDTPLEASYSEVSSSGVSATMPSS
jgi:hypothetical protein